MSAISPKSLLRLATPRIASHRAAPAISEKSPTINGLSDLNHVHSTGARLLPSRTNRITLSLFRGSAGTSPSPIGHPQSPVFALTRHSESEIGHQRLTHSLERHRVTVWGTGFLRVHAPRR